MLLYSGLLNLNWLLNPTFTLFESSRVLGKMSMSHDVILGDTAHSLSIENGMLPIFWVPHTKSLANINSPVWSYHPKYLLQTVLFDSRKPFVKEGWGWPNNSDFRGRKLNLVKKVCLYPYPGTNKYRSELALFKIN